MRTTASAGSTSWTFLADKVTLEAYLDVLNITGRDEVVAYQYGTVGGQTYPTSVVQKLPTSVPIFYPSLGIKGTY